MSNRPQQADQSRRPASHRLETRLDPMRPHAYGRFRGVNFRTFPENLRGISQLYCRLGNLRRIAFASIATSEMPERAVSNRAIGYK